MNVDTLATPAAVHPAARAVHVVKGAVVVLLACALATAVWFLYATPAGAEVRRHPEQAAVDARAFVARHPLAAPAVYVGVYFTFGTLALPVLWLQVLAGVAFGLWVGCAWSLVGSVASAGATAATARWVAGEWFHKRVESKLQRLRKLDELLGHNGLLLVMSIRLVHLLPFGLSNYALGLTRVSLRDVAIGTLLGNIPATAIYVGLGAGYDPRRDWGFDAAIASVNLVLLLPLILRYLRPAWFRRIGVE